LSRFASGVTNSSEQNAQSIKGLRFARITEHLANEMRAKRVEGIWRRDAFCIKRKFL